MLPLTYCTQSEESRVNTGERFTFLPLPSLGLRVCMGGADRAHGRAGLGWGGQGLLARPADTQQKLRESSRKTLPLAHPSLLQEGGIRQARR